MAESAISNEELAHHLRSILSDELKESERQWPYRAAAAVLSYFDIDSINPLDGSHDKQEALECLLGSSHHVYNSERQPCWTLRSDVRKDALQRLYREGAVEQALAANPQRPSDLLQRMLEAYISYQATPLESQTREELICTMQISEWLSGVLEGVPRTDEVLQRIETENLYATFQFLVGDHFRGRENELRRLSDYVGIKTASSISEYLKRTVREIRGLQDKPPLLIYGPGGMGKSTLLAKFVLDHIRFANADERFPFAYLDFDRPSLIAEEPLTLLLEAARQLAIQFPESRVSLTRMRDEWLQRINRERESPAQQARIRQRSSDVSPPGLDQSSVRERMESSSVRLTNRKLFMREFAEELEPLTLGDRPFLLILDTFEEVQYRSHAFVDEVFSFLNDLQGIVPMLRTVVSGRAQVQLKRFKTDDLFLSSFDPEAAQGFLLSHGISDPALAEKVATQVGGSPLTLKLAAELLTKEEAGEKGIQDLQVREGFFRRLKDEAIQAQLFGRILDHIHDKEVIKLAHPGLVLRRITPELILEVLAKPCSIKVRDSEDARRLFQKLSREVSLVTQTDDEVLVHRPDLRSVMLEMIREKEPSKVRQIHKRAIDFYAERQDDPSRAEEIYHRLSLGLQRQGPNDRKTLESRWSDSVRLYLGSAIEELPVRSQAFLAARLGMEIPEEAWAKADLEDWELHATRRATDLMMLEKNIEALEALRQRNERSPESSIVLLERRSLILALQQVQLFYSHYPDTRLSRAAMEKAYEALIWVLKNELDRQLPSRIQGLGPTNSAKLRIDFRNKLARAFTEAFTPEEFQQFIFEHFAGRLRPFPSTMNYAKMVYDTIDSAERENRLNKLITVALAENRVFTEKVKEQNIYYDALMAQTVEQIANPPDTSTAWGEEVVTAVNSILEVLQKAQPGFTLEHLLAGMTPKLQGLFAEYTKHSAVVA